MNIRDRLARPAQAVLTGGDLRPHSFLGAVLGAASRVYGAAVKARGSLYRSGIFRSRRLPCPVVSIGNLTVGGTGKTPMTLYMARLLAAMGCRPVVVSRGYRGSSEKKGGVVSDGRRLLMGPDEAGDEPCMLALDLGNVPVVVGADRYAAGMLAVRLFSPKVVILDDGFQHRGLGRDLDLLLVDGRCPFGNGRLLPAGPLREPVSAGRRAHAVIVTRWDQAPSADRIRRCVSGLGRPVFRSVHVPVVHGPAARRLRERTVYAFSGTANNDDFRGTVAGLCRRLAGFCPFPDHHRYSDADLAAIARKAAAAGADILATTDKDHARIGNRAWPLDLVTVGIRTDFQSDTAAFHRWVGSRLQRAAAR